MTPLNPGQLKIPSRSFSFFNPETEKFTILESASIPIQVDPGEEWVNSSYKPIPSTKNSTSQNTPDMFQTENVPGEWNKDMRNKTLIDTKSFWIAQFH
jgi:hypothetical protein